jgi:hypothetical protein
MFPEISVPSKHIWKLKVISNTHSNMREVILHRVFRRSRSLQILPFSVAGRTYNGCYKWANIVLLHATGFSQRQTAETFHRRHPKRTTCRAICWSNLFMISGYREYFRQTYSTSPEKFNWTWRQYCCTCEHRTKSKTIVDKGCIWNCTSRDTCRLHGIMQRYKFNPYKITLCTRITWRLIKVAELNFMNP